MPPSADTPAAESKVGHITARVPAEVEAEFLEVATARGFVYQRTGKVHRSDAAGEAIREWVARYGGRRSGQERRGTVTRDRRKDAAA